MLDPDEQQLLKRLEKVLPEYHKQQQLKLDSARDKALQTEKTKLERERVNGHLVTIIYPEREERVFIPGKEEK